MPLTADVHHQGTAIAVEAAKHVDEVRVNPGLFVFHKHTPNQLEYSAEEHIREIEAIETSFMPVIEGV